MASLREFLDGLPRGETGALALKLGISAIYLAQIAARQGGREPSPALCVLIERETAGAVMRWDLRPSDWHRIWPELIGTPGAPEVEARPSAPEPQPEPPRPNPPQSGNGRRGRSASATPIESEPSLAASTSAP